MADNRLLQAIRHNCEISDARDNGIYSICMLVLKLRNLYKWENDIQPWEEPETGELLDWIDAKEKYWETISENEYHSLPIGESSTDPYDLHDVNEFLQTEGLFYGAGYGRSLKSIFFLSEKIREETAEGCPVVVLGREIARELSSPFAMLQDGMIIIRRDPLRFFFWDHIQEIRSSCKSSLQHALKHYGILKDGQLDQEAFRTELDNLVDTEIPIFVYHEVGEMKQHTFDSDTLRRIVSTFPDSAIEYVARAVKDVLADTHVEGMLSFIVREQRDASLGFYVGFLAGLRKHLSPQIIEGYDRFLATGNWEGIEHARIACRDANLGLADTIRNISDRIGQDEEGQIKLRFYDEVLTPLGLDVPEQEE